MAPLGPQSFCHFGRAVIGHQKRPPPKPGILRLCYAFHGRFWGLSGPTPSIVAATLVISRMQPISALPS